MNKQQENNHINTVSLRKSGHTRTNYFQVPWNPSTPCPLLIRAPFKL